MRYAATSGGELISIEKYAASPNTPQALTCPGQAPDGRPCRATAWAKALNSPYVRPHFAAKEHITDCDEGEAAVRARKGHRDGSTTTRTRHEGPTLLLITPSSTPGKDTRTPTTRTKASGRPMATAITGPASRRSAPTARKVPLASLLARALSGRLDPETTLALPDKTRGPVSRLLIPANTLTKDHDGLHACFYGRVTDYAENTATRSVFLNLKPRPGTSRRNTAGFMIREDQAPSVQDNLDASIGDLVDHHVIVIGALRVSANRGSLYIVLDDTDSITYQR
ncbi:hypothetical protein [Actinomyces sp. 565]|uniref:hypothetical protein n=1 Tax=Actinomyces sp. 565 TaxID=2057794 RepID=UPI0013A6EA45|nr:hypothetical protein [Actinomyces sp. 565]NDR53866.1 hypothetical protein [Actinomyces sp. 565]